MNYICSVCAAACDELGNAITIIGDQEPPVQKLTCIACRLKACAEKSRRPIRYKRRPLFNVKLAGKLSTINLPYKDE